ncbi:MAG TPA: HigA family addiction module antitoxin [Parapedobacter sp.]|uniref:HigA family addiction module antitoxin n=1 Tax=Parapedobacter sp. TaxID=1958893 RepID=UPI002CEE5472|nr:HigA family addiction module antitoxin [Parapedobacter sp.]HWK59641.1 HigA family addiction module antitoxin [Parapedobacter sp.]
MERLPNIHPGEILNEEFLLPMNITPYRLAKDTGIPQTRVSQIIKGHRRITADTAIRLSRFFGNSVKFWLGIQDDYDIRTTLDEKKEEFENIKQVVFA